MGGVFTVERARRVVGLPALRRPCRGTYLPSRYHIGSLSVQLWSPSLCRNFSHACRDRHLRMGNTVSVEKAVKVALLNWAWNGDASECPRPFPTLVPSTVSHSDPHLVER